MIHVYENFLSEDYCKQLIDFYHENSRKSYKYRDTFPLTLPKIEKITDQLISLCSECGEKSKSDLCQIVRWPVGSKQDPHHDFYIDTFASVIYLNDDYEGGKTCFEDREIVPKTGTMIFFTGSKDLHWVEKVKKSERYTLSHWFIPLQS
jgi:hypothetical protein|tara:strand:+ start:580 stop:1026 length:447 start_codon:yes stop_codon:yes gene_type:complete